MTSSITTQRTTSPWLGRGLCAAAAVLWSTSGLFIKSLTFALPVGAGWNGWQVAGLRSLFAALALFTFARPRRYRPTWHQLAIAMATWPTLLTYVLAQTHTTTANAIFLQYTSPLWVFAFSPILLKEKPTKVDILAVPALLAGMALILHSQLSLGFSRFGDVMGLLSGVGYATIIMLLRKWRDGSSVLGLAWGNVIVACIALPAACTGGREIVMPNLSTMTQIIFLGVFQIGTAYFLFQWALRGITAAEASMLSLIEPVLCPLWAWLVVNDVPGPRSLMGGGVILVTLLLHTAWVSRSRRGIAGTPRG